MTHFLMLFHLRYISISPTAVVGGKKNENGEILPTAEWRERCSLILGKNVSVLT